MKQRKVVLIYETVDMYPTCPVKSFGEIPFQTTSKLLCMIFYHSEGDRWYDDPIVVIDTIGNKMNKVLCLKQLACLESMLITQ